MISIVVRFFGSLTDIVSGTQTALEVASPATVESVANELLKTYPALSKQVFRTFHNQKLAQSDTRLSDGDEISLMPPFSGG